MKEQEIVEMFTFYERTREGAARVSRLSDLFIELMSELDEIVPDGPAKDVVTTMLQTAHLWCQAGVSRDLETR